MMFIIIWCIFSFTWIVRIIRSCWFVVMLLILMCMLIMDMIMFWCWLWSYLLIIMMMLVELLWWWCLLNYYDDDVGELYMYSKHVFKYVGELYMYMCIYVVDEFLACYWRRFDGVSMYWNMLVLIWWRMCEHMHCCWWVICSCIHDWWWRILYPYWWRLWCVCCIMRWRPRSCLGTTCI